MISKKEVQHIAQLARIALTPEEEERFCKELSLILEFVDKLKELDVSNIKSDFSFLPLKNVMREDDIKPQAKEIVKNLQKLMPQTEKDFLKIKSIFKRS